MNSTDNFKTILHFSRFETEEAIFNEFKELEESNLNMRYSMFVKSWAKKDVQWKNDDMIIERIPKYAR